MICEHITLTMDSTAPSDVAKAMLKFWLFQAAQAKVKCLSSKAQLDSARKTNKKVEEEMRDSFFLSLPFNDYDFRAFEHRIAVEEKNLEEANAMVGYMINFITDRAHMSS